MTPFQFITLLSSVLFLNITYGVFAWYKIGRIYRERDLLRRDLKRSRELEDYWNKKHMDCAERLKVITDGMIEAYSRQNPKMPVTPKYSDFL